MADTTMESALVALATALDAATTLEVIRNSDRPEKIPSGGLVVLRDGAQGEVEESFSPLRYHIQHVAEVVILAPTEDARDDALKDLSDALVANRTLTGAVEYVAIQPVSFDMADFDGAEGLRGALMPVELHYTVLGSPAG
jgi:hypothetical protein